MDRSWTHFERLRDGGTMNDGRSPSRGKRPARRSRQSLVLEKCDSVPRGMLTYVGRRIQNDKCVGEPRPAPLVN